MTVASRKSIFFHVRPDPEFIITQSVATQRLVLQVRLLTMVTTTECCSHPYRKPGTVSEVTVASSEPLHPSFWVSSFQEYNTYPSGCAIYPRVYACEHLTRSWTTAINLPRHACGLKQLEPRLLWHGSNGGGDRRFSRVGRRPTDKTV